MKTKDWFNISEIEPEQYEDLLGWNLSHELYFVCFFDGENYRDFLHGKIIVITHWQYITPLQTKLNNQ